jgi:hypothetical protein
MGVLEELQERVKRLEEAVGSAPMAGFIDQKKSPLGPKRHCAVTRRLWAAGDPRAMIGSGRRFLLTMDAIKEELRSGVSPSISAGHSSEEDEFYRSLMKEVGGD